MFDKKKNKNLMRIIESGEYEKFGDIKEQIESDRTRGCVLVESEEGRVAYAKEDEKDMSRDKRIEFTEYELDGKKIKIHEIGTLTPKDKGYFNLLNKINFAKGKGQSYKS